MQQTGGVGINEANYHYVIRSLHGLDGKSQTPWNPHPSQKLVGQSLFQRGCKNIFIQCGRKWGKTEIIVYCLWRWALLNPNSACYYICPIIKQAREIIWESKNRQGRDRLPQFGSSEFIESIDNTEMRITFKNGSFIKVDGSDNFDAWAGISPNFIVLDEFRSFKPEFYGVMNPNRAVFNAPMIIMGTPPEQIWIDKDNEHQYIEIAKEIRMDMLEGGDSFWIKRPSWDNPDPVIQRFLAAEKKRLFRRGKQDEWFREYGAELVPGGSSKIFRKFISDPTMPMSHVVPHSEMVGYLLKEQNVIVKS